MSEHDDNRYDEMTDEKDTEAMTTYAEPELDYDDSDDYDEFGDDANTPGRPRRVLVNRYSVGLVVVLVGAACFYAGVRVEKSQVSGSGTTAGGLASRFAALTGGTSARSGASKTGASGFAGFAGRSGGSGFGTAAGGGTEGTISSIDGDTLYITESSGDTVKVKLDGATTLTKTVTVGKRSLYPGDTVSVSGASGSGGTVTATSVADSGNSSTSSTSSTSSSSTSSSTGSTSSTGSSGLSSLFGGS